MIWLIQGQSLSRTGLLAGTIVELCLGSIALVYAVLPVRRAYDARWYRLFLAAITALLVLVAAALGFDELAQLIASRLPPN